MIRRPPRSTRTDTLFPSRRSSDLFRDRIFPVLTPLAVDPAQPFPYISGLSLNLAVMIRNPRTEKEHRSEEHTSELQSLMRISYAVFCLKKKKEQKLKPIH